MAFEDERNVLNTRSVLVSPYEWSKSRLCLYAGKNGSSLHDHCGTGDSTGLGVW